MVLSRIYIKDTFTANGPSIPGIPYPVLDGSAPEMAVLSGWSDAYTQLSGGGIPAYLGNPDNWRWSDSSGLGTRPLSRAYGHVFNYLDGTTSSLGRKNIRTNASPLIEAFNIPIQSIGGGSAYNRLSSSITLDMSFSNSSSALRQELLVPMSITLVVAPASGSPLGPVSFMIAVSFIVRIRKGPGIPFNGVDIDMSLYVNSYGDSPAMRSLANSYVSSVYGGGSLIAADTEDPLSLGRSIASRRLIRVRNPTNRVVLTYEDGLFSFKTLCDDMGATVFSDGYYSLADIIAPEFLPYYSDYRPGGRVMRVLPSGRPPVLPGTLANWTISEYPLSSNGGTTGSLEMSDWYFDDETPPSTPPIASEPALMLDSYELDIRRSSKTGWRLGSIG